jgi:hypothetical protein
MLKVSLRSSRPYLAHVGWLDKVAQVALDAEDAALLQVPAHRRN